MNAFVFVSRRNRRGQRRLVITALALVCLTACSPAPSSAATATSAPQASTIDVTLIDGTVQMPATLPAGPTTLNVTNTGTTEHSLEVEGQGVEAAIEPHLQPGASGTLQVELEPGTYEFYCPVPGHREGGMTLAVTVTEG
jgi:plastocyanin